MKALMAVLLSTFCFAASSQAPSSIHVQKWRFPVRQGEASAVLDQGAEHSFVLSLRGPSCEACVSFPEFAGVLRDVLAKLPSLGIKPAQLSMIFLSIEDPQVKAGLKAAALHSAAWKQCEASRGCGGNAIVKGLLNDIDAVRPFNEVLSAYHLSTKVASVEDISTTRVSPQEASKVSKGITSGMRVPEDANLELVVMSDVSAKVQ